MSANTENSKDRKLIECVPNISEGRNEETIEALKQAIKSVDQVLLLNTDTGYIVNRTVFTFVGPPDAVFEAAFRLYQVALQRINMAQHTGKHPRIGAVDVCPFVALRNMSNEELRERVALFSKRIAKELHISGFFYELSALNNQRKNLAYIRKGEYEGLDSKLKQSDWKPDFGNLKPSVIKKFGITVIGVRNFLVAFNVNLLTDKVEIANDIACEVRELGKILPSPGGGMVRLPGMLKSVKAIGWFIEEFNLSQVSFNLTDITQNGMAEVYTITETLARRRKVALKGSELIGMVPLRELIRSSKYFMERDRVRNIHELTEDEIVDKGIEYLGLAAVKPFDKDKNIIEYRIRALEAELGFKVLD
jgi:glutamate formiminotransferase/formiminotetrahydrofolate cyclodeaminase